MRLLRAACLVFLAPGLILAQANTPKADSSSDDTAVAKELKAMRDALAENQKQIARQQAEIERLKQERAAKQAVPADTADGAPRALDAALHSTPTAVASPVLNPHLGAQDEPKESPLSFRIGGAEFTPGGFVDFENIFRSTNTGSVVGTSFNAIPFNNTVPGHLTEFRITGQASRLSLKATSKFGKNHVTGYAEMDFNGNDAANVFVSTNSHTDRLRLYWMDVKRGKWEFLAGQTWSFLTPNRVGVSPLPNDIFSTRNVDHNYQVGLTWTRAGSVRVVYHPNDNWALGIAAENPDQFVNAGEVIFPFAFNAALGPQFDAANQTTIPNFHPDIIPKITYDNDVDGKHFHVEVAGLLSTVKTTNVNFATGQFESHTATGAGGSAGANLELAKGFRVVANGFWSEGGGRYIGGLGPQAVVHPIQIATGLFTIEPTLVHAGSTVFGFEAQVTPKTQFAAYYGGAYFGRNAFPDVTNPAPPPLLPFACETGKPLQFKPCIGFGGLNSPNSANRAIQEGTFDWTQTLWKQPQYGELSLITQYSYLTRAPWFVAAGAPKNAHLSMGYMALRYILP